MKAMLKRAIIIIGLAAQHAWAQTVIQNITYNSGQTLTISDPVSITAGPNVTVSNGANITLATPGPIILLPGFLAATGSTFNALINGQIGSLQQTSTTPTSASFSWTTLAGSNPISYYNIYKNGTLIGTNGAGVLSFSDTTLLSNLAYTYTVTAVDTKGNASATATININTPGPTGTLPSGYQVVLLVPSSQFYGVTTGWAMLPVTP